LSFEYLTNTPLSEAREQYISLLVENGLKASSELVDVADSAGRLTSEAVYATISSPHYNASAMDGIALDASLTFGATETTPVFLSEGQYTIVDTGDPLPSGCDTVVMIEDVVAAEGGVRLYAAAAPWENIRQIGEDICAGEMVLASFTQISPSAVGAMIAGGVLEVPVVKRPVVGIIPTGDEIVMPTESPKEGDILEFNSSIFSAMLRDWGAEPVTFPIVKDDLALIKQALADALASCDIVLINAGASAGRDDYTAQAIAAVGEAPFHGIAIKPGKPAILGYAGPKPVLGIPGYPVSGIIVIEELLRPILEILECRKLESGNYREAVLTKAVVSSLKYEEFVRVRLGYVEGKLIASPLNRGSGVVTSFMKADGILTVAQGLEGYEQGEKVQVRLLRPESDLRGSLVVIGSHDPLIDEVSDIMKRKYRDISVSSSHVGSMGGLIAIKRGEAHTGGTHLLDEATGTYNVPYIQAQFPNGGVRLIECVYRTQGIMVRAGNPLGIASVAGLAREGLRYVNRQKGSGTRVLIDYLCKREGIDTSVIYGYDREEYTHTSVAALIAAGSADAGMGIYSAAKIYGLGFIPICEEQYDLLVPDYAWGTLLIERLLETLKSREFAGRLAALGGYTLENPGAVRQRF